MAQRSEEAAGGNRLPITAYGHDLGMGDGDIHVARDGDDWVVSIEGIKGTGFRYETREDALSTGRRVATAARSTLRIHHDALTQNGERPAAGAERGLVAEPG